jgi:hypothetical protein
MKLSDYNWINIEIHWLKMDNLKFNGQMWNWVKIYPIFLYKIININKKN